MEREEAGENIIAVGSSSAGSGSLNAWVRPGSINFLLGPNCGGPIGSPLNRMGPGLGEMSQRAGPTRPDPSLFIRPSVGVDQTMGPIWDVLLRDNISVPFPEQHLWIADIGAILPMKTKTRGAQRALT